MKLVTSRKVARFKQHWHDYSDSMPSSYSIATCLAIPVFAWPLVSAADEKLSGPAKPEIETLETRKDAYYIGYVSRVETDGFVIKHDGGLARFPSSI